MKNFLLKLSLFLAVACTVQAAHAQTTPTCSISTPCIKAGWNATDAAATSTFDSSFVQQAGPEVEFFGYCVGSSTSCSAAAYTTALTNFIANGTTGGSVWEITQINNVTAVPQTYLHQATWNSLVNICVTSAFLTPTGTVPALTVGLLNPSAIFQAQITQPASSPVAPAPTGLGFTVVQTN